MNQLEVYYNELLNTSGKIVTFFSLLPFLFGLYYYKSFNKPLKVFFGYIVFGLVLNILAELFIWSVNVTSHYEAFWKSILAYTKIEDTNFFNGFSYFANFLFWGWFYFLIFKNAKYATWLRWLTIALCVFQVFNYIFIDGFRSKGTIGLALSNIFCLVLSAIYLWYMSAYPPQLPVKKNAYFLISITLFLHTLVSVIYSFTAAPLYETNFVLYCKIKIFRNALGIIMQLVFILAFVKAKYLPFLKNAL